MVDDEGRPIGSTEAEAEAEVETEGNEEGPASEQTFDDIEVPLFFLSEDQRERSIFFPSQIYHS